MAHLVLHAFLPRFAFGLAGAVAAGWLTFRSSALDYSDPAFQCISVGALTAAILAAMRISHRGFALLFVVLFGLLQLGLVDSMGWLRAVGGLFLAAGIWLAALVFDLLGRRGIFFGKFLILGAMLAGLYLALTPVVEFYSLSSSGVMRTLLSRVLLGLVIGDGAGLGVELVELFAGHGRRRGSVTDPPAQPMTGSSS